MSDLVTYRTTGGEALSFESLGIVTDASAVATPVEVNVRAQRSERARSAARQREQQQGLVYTLRGRSRLYWHWQLEDAAGTGPSVLRAEKAIMLRSPVPAVVELTQYGEPILIEYARGPDVVTCRYCQESCPKEGRKFLVVVSPWGLWCPSCAHKAPSLVGEAGKRQRMAERRRLKTRSSSSVKAVGAAR